MDDHDHNICRDCPRTWDRIADLEARLKVAESKVVAAMQNRSCLSNDVNKLHRAYSQEDEN